jgi:hypothetical protein
VQTLGLDTLTINQVSAAGESTDPLDSEAKENLAMSYHHQLHGLQEDVRSSKYATLPELSRRLRVVLLSIEESLHGLLHSPEYQAQHPQRHLDANLNIGGEFKLRWSSLVPKLTALSKASAASCSSAPVDSKQKSKKSESAEGGDADGDDEDSDDEGCVEQEGCPDDTDFNRQVWHGCRRVPVMTVVNVCQVESSLQCSNLRRRCTEECRRG